MRVASQTSLLDVAPGDTTEFVVEVVNTSEVIDGVSTRVIGLPEPSVTSSPALLPLFPQTSGQVVLSLAVPATHPAGQHSLTVEVTSHGAGVAPQFLDVDLLVAARPGMTIAARPKMVRAHRQARFVLEITNCGNLPLDVTLRAVDIDRSCVASFAPDRLRIAAGAVAPVLLIVSGPRMIFGAELDRTITVAAQARSIDAPDAKPEAGPDAEPDAPNARPQAQIAQETTVRLRQRPRISRGLLTALILASIIALWAAVFLLGLNKVFAGDPMTKAAPASFFAATSGRGADQVTDAGGLAGVPNAEGAAPAGALPKSGQLPPGIGGGISGRVIAASDHQPVGRILVEALRRSPHGLQVVSSAATQSDGTYALAGLFPTDYVLRFSASGYRTVWYPAATSQSGATTVSAASQSVSDGVDVTIRGNPASISGSVDPGDTLTAVHTTVVARSLEGDGTGPVATATTSASGTYTLRNLPAPGNYELTFTATGYEPTTVVDDVAGGQQRLEPTVQLAVGMGEISGTVTDGSAPLGGATISTTVGGKAFTLTTPTTGTVGAFLLGNLPTPATYVITFSRAGYGTQTSVIDLTAGQNRNGLNAALAAGTGSVSGRLVGSDGKGLGGATVTVGGATSTGTGAGTGSTPSPPGATLSPGGSASNAPGSAPNQSESVPTTTTLTSGAVGTFAINGLAAPGSYTLTFTLAGYAPATVPVTLSASGPPSTVTVTLSTQLGQIRGRVTGPDGAPFVGATVTATDGTRTWTATSTSGGAGLPAGGYFIDELQPGTYAVTVTAPAMAQQTALVAVAAGAPSLQNLRLGG